MKSQITLCANAVIIPLVHIFAHRHTHKIQDIILYNFLFEFIYIIPQYYTFYLPKCFFINSYSQLNIVNSLILITSLHTLLSKQKAGAIDPALTTLFLHKRHVFTFSNLISGGTHANKGLPEFSLIPAALC